MEPPPEVDAGEDDAALVARSTAGDRLAFGALFRRYKGDVFRFARHMGCAREAAEDVTQEVFIVFMETSARYDPTFGPLRTYLYGITRNLLRRRFRKAVMCPEIELERIDAESVAAAPAGDAVDRMERTRSLTWLRRAIATLPPRYREVVVLCDLHEVQYEDAARVVGCPVGTIRSRLSRARRLLAQRWRTQTQTGSCDIACSGRRRCMA
jgi:RNA polymerase sigma-70 factor (ECF subfamily)